jgi:hypothetical protein
MNAGFYEKTLIWLFLELVLIQKKSRKNIPLSQLMSLLAFQATTAVKLT